MPRIKTIAFDADDTLWSHQNYFSEGRAAFEKVMSHYKPTGDAGQAVDDIHIKNLDIYGYGVKSFTLSMIEAAIGLTDKKISHEHIQDLLDIGKGMLKHPIHLLDGVEKTLKTLSASEVYRVIMITKGDLFAQEDKVERSGLREYFDHIEVVSEKDPQTYQAVFEKYKIDTASTLMIGNSIKSDIIPLLQIGAQAIHIPYHTTWEHEKVESAHVEDYDFLILDAMTDLVEVLIWAADHPDQPVHTYLTK